MFLFILSGLKIQVYILIDQVLLGSLNQIIQYCIPEILNFDFSNSSLLIKVTQQLLSKYESIYLSHIYLPSNSRMSILSHRLPPRSISMPIMPTNNIQPIHKIRKNRLNDHHLHAIELQAIKDKEGDQLFSKIKLIQKRNMQKLQEKYQTIDRWREKYIPQSSVLIIKQKIQKPNKFPILTIGNKNSSFNSHISVNLQIKIDRLPFIASKKVKNLAANVPDQRQLSRRIEIQLMARLQRNKRYYKKDSIVENSSSFQPQNFDQSSKKDKGKEQSSTLAYKKLKISHNSQMNVLNKALKSQRRTNKLIFNPQQNKKEVFKEQAIIKAPKIIKLKQSLLNEAAEETPQGWQVQNETFAFVEESYQ